MADTPTAPAADSPESIAARLEVVKPVKGHDPVEVWEMKDPKTGKRYFAKISDPREIEMTKKAGEVKLPENSTIKIAGMLASGNNNVPDALKGQVKAVDNRTSFLIVEAVPTGTSLSDVIYGAFGAEENVIPEEWKKNPITVSHCASACPHLQYRFPRIHPCRWRFS
jgi:hypothetical protein